MCRVDIVCRFDVYWNLFVDLVIWLLVGLVSVWCFGSCFLCWFRVCMFNKFVHVVGCFLLFSVLVFSFALLMVAGFLSCGKLFGVWLVEVVRLWLIVNCGLLC